MKSPSSFALTVVVLIVVVICGTMLVALGRMPPDTLEKMFLLIVGGALGAMQASNQPAAAAALPRGASQAPPGVKP